MLFFFIALTVLVLALTFLFTTASTGSAGDGAFATWFAFCFLAGGWALGLFIFVAHHFISKYW